MARKLQLDDDTCARAYLMLNPKDGSTWFSAVLALATLVLYAEDRGETDPTVSGPRRDPSVLRRLLEDARAWLGDTEPASREIQPERLPELF